MLDAGSENFQPPIMSDNKLLKTPYLLIQLAANFGDEALHRVHEML